MYFGLLMFFCMVPVLFFVFISMYPWKWENKNRIFGVNNRPEFNNEKSHEFINIVTATHRKEALIILILLVLIAAPCHSGFYHENDRMECLYLRCIFCNSRSLCSRQFGNEEI